MKKLFFLLAFFTLNTSAFCQTWDTVSRGSINVYQQSMITPLLSNYRVYNELNRAVQGYRVQIIASTVRKTVLDSKGIFSDQYPDIKTYILYQQPYFKLRVGDFETRIEAIQFLNKINDVFPSAFIVQDDIKVSEN